WWYGAFRHQHQSQNFAVLQDDTAQINLPIRSFKGTYQMSQNNKMSGYYSRGTKTHSQYSPGTQVTNAASLSNQIYPTGTYSVTYDGVVKQNLVAVLRTGAWYEERFYIGKCNEIPNGKGGFGIGDCRIRYQD